MSTAVINGFTLNQKDLLNPSDESVKNAASLAVLFAKANTNGGDLIKAEVKNALSALGINPDTVNGIEDLNSMTKAQFTNYAEGLLANRLLTSRKSMEVIYKAISGNENKDPAGLSYKELSQALEQARTSGNLNAIIEKAISLTMPANLRPAGAQAASKPETPKPAATTTTGTATATIPPLKRFDNPVTITRTPVPIPRNTPDPAVTARSINALGRTLDPDTFTAVGTITPRSSNEADAAGITNKFGIGFETTDRGYTDPTAVLPNLDASNKVVGVDRLGPLGAQRARIQSGWGDVQRGTLDELKKGDPDKIYDFAKLDFVVNGAVRAGVNPFMGLLLGNEAYLNVPFPKTQDGVPVDPYTLTTKDPKTKEEIQTPVGPGGTRATKFLPVGQAREDWMEYVTTIAARYKGKVSEFEIWNEPDIRGVFYNQAKPELFGQFVFDTATALKKGNPDAKIFIGGFAEISKTSREEYIKPALDAFEALRAAVPEEINGKPNPLYIDKSDVSVSYHYYNKNPDLASKDGAYASFLKFLKPYGYKPVQGENGVNSEPGEGFALGGKDTKWDEDDQARFISRRMLLDQADPNIDVTNIFSIMDLHYKGQNGLNTKGLIQTGDQYKDSIGTDSYGNEINGDLSFKRTKPAYSTYQNVTSIFDDRMVPVTNAKIKAPPGYTVQAYTQTVDGVERNLLAVWRNTDAPGTNEKTAKIDITVDNFTFSGYKADNTKPPQFGDLLSGKVYDTASTGASPLVQLTATGIKLNDLPVSDYPIIIADQGIITSTPLPKPKPATPATPAATTAPKPKPTP
jgi:hypothetical protein